MTLNAFNRAKVLSRTLPAKLRQPLSLSEKLRTMRNLQVIRLNIQCEEGHTLRFSPDGNHLCVKCHRPHFDPKASK